MKVILKKSIKTLGRVADEVNVKPGYARNFLLVGQDPIAVLATEKNRAEVEKIRSELEAKMAAEKAVAEKRREKLMALPKLRLIHEARDNVLYGSVTAKEVVDAIKAAGGEALEAHDVRLPGHIKTTGAFKVEIVLHQDVVGEIEILVEASESSDEA